MRRKRGWLKWSDALREARQLRMQGEKVRVVFKRSLRRNGRFLVVDE